MKTAIDSSALLSIFNGEAKADAWIRILIEARRQGQLVICDVVYAELSPAFRSKSQLDGAIKKLGIVFESTSVEAAWKAGAVFRSYREAGGPRTFLIPDFLIAAHALVHADQLLAFDRGYLRRYFKSLKVIFPDD
ncbi:MAG: type II toxin-antitoxin system VapC family toxin [Verrucomicrobia bacterium]|jgi:predicted nucleic acid-binding protein|nr:type II toxin-antitoxin system VapC family toxin [Verrucomicrobiota bacterium]